jgi:DNA-binding NtrC family response regulator
MPGMDGLTLLQHLVSRYPHVCPIMVTACSDMRSIRTAMNHGALDFLIKPVDFADLEATLRKAARQARRLRMSENYVRMVGKEARTAFAVIRDGDIVFVNNGTRCLMSR